MLEKEKTSRHVCCLDTEKLWVRFGLEVLVLAQVKLFRTKE